MATEQSGTLDFTFNFDNSFEAAKEKILSLDPSYRYFIDDDGEKEEEFKRSFISQFSPFIDQNSEESDFERVGIVTEVLTTTLTVLLQRFYRTGQMVRAEDLATFITFIEWLKEAWKTITNL